VRILIVTPAKVGSNLGNAVTAQRFGAIFRSAKWSARVARDYDGQDVDLLVALHARKSAASIERFRHNYPERPVIVVLTGTDVYRDLRTSRSARRALELATAIVVLQPLAALKVSPRLRSRTHSIIQSAPARKPIPSPARSQVLHICVLGHLRAEKDPLRAAAAVRLLPPSALVQVTQAGAALERRFAAAARKEMQRNGRYRWVGGLPRTAATRLLRESDVMVLSSLMEGGANVLCEAIACGIPVLASRVPGNIGILGHGYPGLFRVRDTRALARLIRRFLEDRVYRTRLTRWINRRRPLVRPTRERRAWVALVRKVAETGHHTR
jgi:putative glycosyltransferase (TIGR04348 family)